MLLHPPPFLHFTSPLHFHLHFSFTIFPKMKNSGTTSLVIQLLVLLLTLLSAVVDAQKPSDADADPWDAGSNASPSMATVVIVLVLGFFITGSIFIYIQHCLDTSSSTASTTTRAIATNNAVRGLDQSVIDTFPLFQYSAVKELRIGKGALECAVCLSEFQDDETLRFLPKCDHVFHSDCIDAWLVGHATCPVCRHNLVSVSVPESDKLLTNSDDSHHNSAPLTPTSISNNDELQITIPVEEETLATSLGSKQGKLRLPRSHSTGHSLVRPAENCERFTLRLPAEVRMQLLARTKLRATSLVALPRQSSSRRGYRGGSGEGSGSSRYGRLFGRSFLMRVGSFRSTAKVVDDGDLKAGTNVSLPPQLHV